MVKFMKRALEQGVRDYENCTARINDVLGRTEIECDLLMDIHFDALYSMMKEKGYDQDDVDYIQENM